MLNMIANINWHDLSDSFEIIFDKLHHNDLVGYYWYSNQVGRLVGLAVVTGLIVGNLVGVLEGMREGTNRVGALEGRHVGDDGNAVGLLDGAMVGDLEGVAVGPLVRAVLGE